jgi:hypothetical protein
MGKFDDFIGVFADANLARIFMQMINTCQKQKFTFIFVRLGFTTFLVGDDFVFVLSLCFIFFPF